MSVPRKEDEDSLQELYNRFYTVRGKLFAKYAYCRRVKKDQEVGCDNGKGYLIVMSKGKLFLVHRIIYYLETGKWPLSVVDHINGNPKDNSQQIKSTGNVIKKIKRFQKEVLARSRSIH